MRIRLRTSHEQGNVLLICLATAGIIGITLASYLNLVGAQNLSTMRSQAWNATVPQLEAGIEEALAHLYQNGRSNLTYLESEGWVLNNNSFVKERDLGDGYYRVAISNVNPPVIYSEGYVRAPLEAGIWVSRRVRVNTKRDALFVKGLVAKGTIKLNGNNVLVDSFDSEDPLYSTNGIYIASKRKDNGDVATNLGLTNAFAGGNANIFGHASTGPGGAIILGPLGKVGSLGWQADATKTGIQPGYSTDDMNASFPAVEPPFNTAPSLSGGPGYQYIASYSGDYQVGDLTGGLLIRSNVQARILVDGNINLTGTDKIRIQPGGSLEIYMRGSDAKIAGNGVVNMTGNAANFFYWGTPTNTKLTVAGNGSFTGVIYAPNADFTFNGGGGTVEDVVGSAVVGTVQMNGNFQFHYDEALGRLNRLRAYVVTDWNEL